MPESHEIVMYGTLWCGDCHRSRAFLDEHEVPYTFIDIDDDPDAAVIVERMQRGGRSVPTIVFADGATLIEPSDADLGAKLGIEVPRRGWFF
jgi:glutaredoxin